MRPNNTAFECNELYITKPICSVIRDRHSNNIMESYMYSLLKSELSLMLLPFYFAKNVKTDY